MYPEFFFATYAVFKYEPFYCDFSLFDGVLGGFFLKAKRKKTMMMTKRNKTKVTVVAATVSTRVILLPQEAYGAETRWHRRLLVLLRRRVAKSLSLIWLRSWGPGVMTIGIDHCGIRSVPCFRTQSHIKRTFFMSRKS